MFQVRAFGVRDASSPVVPFAIERREPGPFDVQIDILYSGICHSDLHQAHNDWGNSMYPMVPGHEIVGRVVKVGNEVSKFKLGDLAGVGCMVDACRSCSACRDDLEQYCEKGAIFTYNGKERDSEQLTYGGYSEQIVVDEHFVVPRIEDVRRQPDHHAVVGGGDALTLGNGFEQDDLGLHRRRMPNRRAKINLLVQCSMVKIGFHSRPAILSWQRHPKEPP